MKIDVTRPLPPPEYESSWVRDIALSLLRDPIAAIALLVVLAIVLMAVLAPWIAPTNPYDLSSLNILDSRLPPGSQSMEGSVYWLGTDGQGRDILSAIIYGLRVSLLVAVVSGVIGLAIGLSLGLLSGYVGGRVDAVIMRIVDLQLSFPTIFVALLILAIFGRGVDKVIFALVVVQWAYYCRAARAAAMVESNKEYIEAARSLNISRWRIVTCHLLPNCLPPVLVVATIQIASSIAIEATLSFLGLGMPPTEPSLGRLIANGFQYTMSGQHWISVFPGLALLVTIAAINLVGDQVRDVLNPRFQK
jgi:peptide/nickel transport system permease protein